ncbi:MAG: hypothetical protein ABIR70_13535 [Bryobacteraceae bacterium]
MKRYAMLLGGLLISWTLTAADAAGPRMSSPVLGYMFDDAAKAIRTISGVPGAASLGEAVPLPSAVTTAYVQSSAREAVVVTKEGEIALASWTNDARVTVLETTLTSLKLVAFSKSGTRFALSEGPTVEVWKATGTPSLVSRYQADAGVTALAVDNEGVVLAATEDKFVMRFSDHGSESLANGADWSAVAFDGTDAIAVDTTHNELVRIPADGGRNVIAALPEFVGALAVAANGESFAVTLPTGLALVSAAGGITHVACDCQPKGLDALEGILTVQIRGTSLLFDASTGVPQLTRVPSLIAVNAGGAN